MKRVERSKITVDAAKFRRCEISSYPGSSWHQRCSFSNMNEFRTLAMGWALYDSQERAKSQAASFHGSPHKRRWLKGLRFKGYCAERWHCTGQQDADRS